MTEPRIVCHRGAGLSAPENTFASAQKAIEMGGSVIELDIRQSIDGVLYVMHDETVDRTTNGSGRLAEMTSIEIDRLDAGSWFHERHTGECIPRLKDFLRAFADKAGFYLEVKKANCEDISNVVRDLDIAHQCFTFSFDPDMRSDMKQYAPDVRQMIQWSTAGGTDAVRETHGAAIVEFDAFDFEKSPVLACRQAGLEVMFYTDKPDRENFRNAIDWHLDYLNIDHIDLFARMRSKPSSSK
ncbi:MAG: glycerophosphodiester phosphodiesterase family protein [Stappiaceae bacterium]